VLFSTVMGALAALWLSRVAARRLARDLELSRVEVARAERVLAWGEMARQVAHEIKNPLTPIRLGVQHLRRARTDPRVNFDRVLDENVTRILSEIDRLDEIARAFSRYGSAPGELPAPESIDVAAILRDVVALEKMGVGDVTWTLAGAEQPVFADARGDELRDVLLNLFENARLARARKVSVKLSRLPGMVAIEIADDGAGIGKADLPRVFEPHFSTRTAGSGLGLAISRRLLESWRGTIAITSEVGKGARVVLTLQSPS
jgi:Signal transduction histidine kinase involved in nitrogen fixation and metabolism regulation